MNGNKYEQDDIPKNVKKTFYRVDGWWRNWRLIRNIVLFLSGLAGITTLTVVWIVTGRTPDSSLLIAFTAMLGLPIFLHLEDKG